jgi:hypothetical protein
MVQPHSRPCRQGWLDLLVDILHMKNLTFLLQEEESGLSTLKTTLSC